MHTKRRWVISPVESAEELARMLTEHTWCLCNGFELGGYWFLNDATHEDAPAEYAVVKKQGPGLGRQPLQVESITMSWCTMAEACEHICRAIAGEYDDADYASPVALVIDTPEQPAVAPAVPEMLT